MLKRATALALAMIMLVGLVGCNQDATTAPPSSDGTTTTAPVTTTTPPTAPPADGPKELVYGQLDVKAVLDRTIVTYIESAQICEQVFEGLLYYNPFTSELLPCLAEGPAKISEDNLTYTFTLKKGIKWHDGTEFTADDVLFSFERIFNPATGSLVVEDYLMIKGAQEVVDGSATTLEGVKVIDPYTVEFTILEPFSLFELFVGTCPLYPRKATTEAGADWGFKVLVGTGPFRFEKYDLDKGVRLVRNDEYHDADRLPTIDSVYYKFYQDLNTMLLDYEAGNVDSLILDAAYVDQYKDDADFGDQLQMFPTFGHFFIIMNFNMDPWKDNPKAREALSYAIDVESICNDLFDGLYLPSSCLLAPSVLGHDPSVPIKKYDPEKAKALLAEAGYPEGVEIKFVTTNLESAGGKMIVAIQQSAAAAGFTIVPEQVDRAVWTTIRNNGEVQTFVASWFLGVGDADGMVYGFFESGNNKFFSSMYVNPEYDKLVADARKTLDETQRGEMYKQADKMLVQDDFVTIPIAWPAAFYMVQPWLVNFQTANYVPNFEHCDIDLTLQPKR